MLRRLLHPLVFLMLLCAMGQASPSDRTALVIGNSAYRFGPLKNPSNDARDVAAKLTGLGFSVVLLENVSFRDMLTAFQEFTRRAQASEVRLVYYAGHGLQYRDGNFLIPVDAELKEEADIPRQTVAFDAVSERLAQVEGGVNILILDACRDNPFSSQFGIASDGRRVRLRGDPAPTGTKAGLAAPRRARAGSLIAFSTEPGSTARDAAGGRNSIYAKHLLSLIDVPNLRIDDMFMKIRTEVVAETQGLQVPWEQTSLQRPFCFRESGARGCGNR